MGGGVGGGGEGRRSHYDQFVFACGKAFEKPEIDPFF